jgi:hypothetical protein
MALVGFVILIPMSANAQNQFPQYWPQWGTWDQPRYQQPYQEHRSQLSKRTRGSERVKHTERTQVPERVRFKKRTIARERPPVKPAIQTERTKAHERGTWQDLDQDDARDFITNEVKAFCNKYKDDKACQQKRE